jgi:hypothetical protein
VSEQPTRPRAFTFTYINTANAILAPRQTIVCEGVETSSGQVAMQTPDKQWHIYNTLNDMQEAFAKHGKGVIQTISTREEKPTNATV